MLLKAKRDTNDSADRVAIDDLIDEPQQKLLPRLAGWAGIAVLTVGAAVIAAQSETGRERIARLTRPEVLPVQIVQRAEPPRQPVSDPLALYETRRLAEQLRILATERDQLADRVAAMERNVGDVTASIPRDRIQLPIPETAPNRETPVPRTATRIIDTQRAAVAPAQPLVVDGSPPASAPVPVPAPHSAPQAAAQAASPAAQDSTAIRTDFGVDLAGESTIEALRARWQQLRAQHGPILEGLRPVVVVQDGARPGTVELRLVVGPLSNANSATRLCVTFSAAGVNCKTAAFDGQRLALR